MNTDTESGFLPKLQQLQFGVEALAAIGEIDNFRGAWPLMSRMKQDQLTVLETGATTDAAGAAGRLEGLPAEDVSRYKAALSAALDTPSAVTAEWVLSLHRILLDGAVNAGAFKTEPNAVEAFDADGKSLGAVFATEKPENVLPRLVELTAWLEGTLAEKDTHPAVTIGLFAALFLEIHPFRVGTIRLASVLTTALLARAGYDYTRYGSLDRAIEGGKYSYYLSLRRSLSTLRTGQTDWKHWLDFFLRALRQQKRELEARIAEGRTVGDDLPELSAQILAIALEHGRVTIATAATATATSRNTIKDHVGRLVEQGHLTLHGAGRGAWYGLR